MKWLERAKRYDLRKLHRVISILAKGETLPSQYRNHRLAGELAQFEECHIESNWLLVYKRDHHALVLVLTRTGTHSRLFNE